MPPPANHADVRATVLSGYESEYKDLLEAWKLVETKAQGAITIAGIFLAGAFSFAKDLKAETSILARIPLLASIALLLIAVLLAVRALVVKKAPRLPAGSTIETLASPLLKVAEPGLPLYLTNLANDQIEVWRETNRALDAAVVVKARQVAQSQWCIFSAATAFVLYTAWVILTR